MQPKSHMQSSPFVSQGGILGSGWAEVSWLMPGIEAIAVMSAQWIMPIDANACVTPPTRTNKASRLTSNRRVVSCVSIAQRVSATLPSVNSELSLGFITD